MAKDAGSALVQRGLLLLAVMTALVIAVWAMLMRGRRQEIPTEPQQPELPAALIGSANAGLSGISWVSVGQMRETLPSPRGWEVRYQAATILARRGSSHVPFDILAEMLDENRQMRNRRAKLQDGREVPDEAAARGTVLIALKALTEWHKHKDAVDAVGQNDAGLQRVYAAIDQLTHSANLVVKTEAEKTRLNLKQG